MGNRRNRRRRGREINRAINKTIIYAGILGIIIWVSALAYLFTHLALVLGIVIAAGAYFLGRYGRSRDNSRLTGENLALRHALNMKPGKPPLIRMNAVSRYPENMPAETGDSWTARPAQPGEPRDNSAYGKPVTRDSLLNDPLSGAKRLGD